MAERVRMSALRDPLPIEFAHAGGWHPGILLGWCSDGPDRCRLRVQCVVGGLRHTMWMSLADLRLPAAPAPVDDVLAWPHRPGVLSTGAPYPRTGERPLSFA